MNDKLSTLDAHIEKLIHLHQQTVIENKKLVELNNSLSSKIEDQNKKIHQLDEQLNTAKLTHATKEVDETKGNEELKKEHQQLHSGNRPLPRNAESLK